jgi:hypothetical protein
MRYTKSMATALALTIGAAAFADDADARRRHHRGGHGDAVAAGVLGLAAGAIIGGALSQPRYHGGYYEPDYYYEPAPVYVAPAPVYVQPAPVYSYAREAWTPDWYAYCEGRYRSFNPQTGYFLGYDGQYHFCR